MDYEKKQPTADCIVARLVPSWGSIVSLLFKATEPYEHYYDEHGEEVPYGAIASWTDVELPPESDDERIRQGLLFFIKKEREKKHLTWDNIPLDVYEAYLEKQKEQKPVSGSSEKPNNHAEWSEEDEKMFELLHTCVCRCINDDRFDYTEREQISRRLIPFIERLKSLRPQPQRRDTYYDIIHNILDTLKDIDFMQITPEHRVSLLNDIRVKCKNADECATILDEPHWKPSEEQMEALENVIKCELSAGMHTRAGILQTLQNDLKKL